MQQKKEADHTKTTNETRANANAVRKLFNFRYSVRYLFFTLAGVFFCQFSDVTAQNSPETIIEYLSGTGYGDTVKWDFYCTKGRNSGKWSEIHVPSCWEQEGFGQYQYGIAFYGQATNPAIVDEQGKYRHQFAVPESWRGKKINIVFDGVMTDAEVRINGRKAGPAHQGGFYRFKYDITDKLNYGSDNLLEVTVSKESENPSVNLAERRADYWNFGGIFRPVFLEIHPELHIDRVAIDAQADGRFLSEIYLSRGANEEILVEARVTDTNGDLVGDAVTSKVSPGSDFVALKTEFDNIRQWTAETPNLYYVNFVLKNVEGEELHILSERFGFRTFEIKPGDGFYLNGQRIIMKGVNRHSFWPESGRTLNKELNYNDVRLMKEMNMNTVRMSHYPPDPEFLDACDELGLYVLNELGGWHGHYDEGVGMKLVGELVRRDVNHPSILFWDNGNEGGWNTELDDEFAKWDPQNRPVLHPQQDLNGVETMHYRSYGETQEYLRGELIFFPTEFLHGLYDGGHGAGLYDYWQIMKDHPRCAGGLLWVFADEGVVRTDQNGRIDNQGNYGADGIVGPHHEKEGSFYAIKEIWSPVQVEEEELPDDLSFRIANEFDFTNLNRCTFHWKLGRFTSPGSDKDGYSVLKEGKQKGPDVRPHSKGSLRLNISSSSTNGAFEWKQADVLYLTAIDPAGNEVWTWSWEIGRYKTKPGGAGKIKVADKDGNYEVTAGAFTYLFDKSAGTLSSVKKGKRAISFSNGPRFIAARRGDRTLDGTVDPSAPKGIDRVYKEISLAQKLENMKVEEQENAVKITAEYFGPLQRVVWRIFSDGQIELKYDYQYDGVVELMGITFDYPEEKMLSVKWLGEGPYRVWQNRLHGTKLNVWENEYNDPIPGETFQYPEFKGYFSGWQWAEFRTEEGKIFISNSQKEDTYLGIYTPRDGRDALLYTLPETGISVFDVIPAVRNKVNATDLIGPSSQPQRVQGVVSHTLFLKFEVER